MNFLLHVHALTVAIAVSYLTLLAADPSTAETCLWGYAVVMLVLTSACLVTERQHRGS